MADVVSFISNPGSNAAQAARGLGGNLLGAGASIATRAAANIPGAGNAIAGLRGILSNLLQPGLQTTPEAEYIAIEPYGTSPLITRTVPAYRDAEGIYAQFMSNILQDFANTPSIMPLWICYLIDPGLSSTLSSFESFDENGGGSHQVFGQGLTNLTKGSHAVGNLGSGLAIMFCQGVTPPSDSYSVSRDNVGSNSGGYLGGYTATNRTLNEISISFLENNASFVDFVLRPWLVTNSYLGIPGSRKCNIIIEQFTRTTPGSPLMLRKQFKLINAFPTQVDAEKLSYKDTNDTRQIQFAYESYVLIGSMPAGIAKPMTSGEYAKMKSESEKIKIQPTQAQDIYASTLNKAAIEYAPKNAEDHIIRPQVSLLDRLKDIAVNTAASLINNQIEKLETNLFSIRPQIKRLVGPQRIQDSKTDVPTEFVAIRGNDEINLEELQDISKQGIVTPPVEDVVTASASRRIAIDSVYRAPKPAPDTITYTPYDNPLPAYIVNKQDVADANKIEVQAKPINKNDIPSVSTVTTQPKVANRQDNPSRVGVQPKAVNRRDIPQVNSIPVQVVNPKTTDFAAGSVNTQSVTINPNDHNS